MNIGFSSHAKIFEKIIIIKHIFKAESTASSMVMGCEMAPKMGVHMAFHISKNVMFKLLEQIIKIEVEIIGFGAFVEFKAASMTTLAIIISSFVFIWQYFIC